MTVSLNQVIPWGRTGSEYELMFNLSQRDLSWDILDCAGGPSSFTAECSGGHGHVVAADPIYGFSNAQIVAQFNKHAVDIVKQVRESEDQWNWQHHGSVDGLLQMRQSALDQFVAHREVEPSRYVCAELPDLPFKTNTFDLALCSHFLFLYSGQLNLDFHLLALKALFRVAREVRVFPLLDLDHQPSQHLDSVIQWLNEHELDYQIETVGYEFMRGGNEMLRIMCRG